MPSYDDRRTMLARDSLASVDGFRIIVALTMEFLFGLRCCPFDPDCNNGEHACPCQDIFGSSSSPEGGLKYKLSLGLDDTHKHIKPTASLRNSSAKTHYSQPLPPITNLPKTQLGHSRFLPPQPWVRSELHGF